MDYETKTAVLSAKQFHLLAEYFLVQVRCFGTGGFRSCAGGTRSRSIPREAQRGLGFFFYLGTIS